MAFVKSASAEFMAAGGVFRAPKIMRGFASFNAATKTINLSRSAMPDAKLGALVEELLHFKQAQRADVFGKAGGWFSRYSRGQWTALAPTLERDVDQTMREMGFHK